MSMPADVYLTAAPFSYIVRAALEGVHAWQKNS